MFLLKYKKSYLKIILKNSPFLKYCFTFVDIVTLTFSSVIVCGTIVTVNIWAKDSGIFSMDSELDKSVLWEILYEKYGETVQI